MGGSSKSQTVGYRYRMGLHLALCLQCSFLAAFLLDRVGFQIAIPDDVGSA